MVNARKYINKEYPTKEQRKHLTILSICSEDLEGHLDLSDFTSLEDLDCSNNKLTSLNVKNLTNLKEIDCSRNKITKLDLNSTSKIEILKCSDNYLSDIKSLLSGLNSEDLKELWLDDNNFSESDLSPFSKFINLEQIIISSNYNRQDYEEDIANRFIGSLEPLKNLSKLKRLDIQNTDIDDGVKYLPEGLKEIFHRAESGKERINSKINKIREELDNYSIKKRLERDYPKKKRTEIFELDISNRELRGNLDLTDFINLQKLDCSNNEINNLNLSNCKKIQSLLVQNNKLSNIDFLNQLPNPSNLKILYLSANNIDSDLNPLSSFTNLEELKLGTNGYSKKIIEEKGDKFHGSLEPLKGLTKLEKLDISNTDIDDGVDYLPSSIVEISYSTQERPKSKVNEIREQLNSLSEPKKEYNLTWKSINKDFTQELQREWEERGFGYEQSKRWADIGLNYTEAELARWLMDEERNKIGEINPQWIENYKKYHQDRKKAKPGVYLARASADRGFEKEKSAQEWLEKKYPTYREKNEATEIDLSCLYFEQTGKLDISDFPKLEEIKCGRTNNNYRIYGINQVIIKNCPKLKVLDVSRLENNQKLTVTDCSELEIIDCSMSKLDKLDISKVPNLKKLNCCDNQLVNLDLSRNYNLEVIDCQLNQIEKIELNCPKLKILNCACNQLVDLDISTLEQLEELDCSDNCLEDFDFNSLKNPKKLTKLDVSKNYLLSESLDIFSKFVNLKVLLLGNNHHRGERKRESFYNHFTGSLKPLEYMSKLEILDISDTDVDEGLEHLPKNLKHLTCSNNGKIDSKVSRLYEELLIYGWNLEAWRENNPNLMKKIWGEDWVTDSCYNISFSGVNLNIPFDSKKYKEIDLIFLDRLKELLGTKGNNHEEILFPERSHNKSKEIIYEDFFLRDNRPFLWEIIQDKEANPHKELPIKLYNVEENKVEETKGWTKLKKYATLSYVWGNCDENNCSVKKVNYQNSDGKNETRDLTITELGEKAFDKVIKTLRVINNEKNRKIKKINPNISERELKESDIKYLWMDKLCVNQNEPEEKNQEVRKMHQYYNNSVATLISINSNVNDEVAIREGCLARETLKKITDSEWFDRSWCFQEGLLSKQSIFMFDDNLVDGRVVASVWTFLQRPNGLLNEDLEGVITPVGWTYCGNNYDLEKNNTTNIRLYDALLAIKDRGRCVSVDGIYSILGLLNYGNEVKPNYKLSKCFQCIEEKNKECSHKDREKQMPKYIKKELEEILLEVVEIAAKKGYNEPLSWIGPRRNKSLLWWIPQINKEGSVEIQETIDVKNRLEETISFNENNIKITGSKYTIKEIKGLSYPPSSKYNSYPGDCLPLITAEDGRKFCLLLSREIIKQVKKGDILIVPKQKWMKRNGGVNDGFGIIIPKKSNNTCSIGYPINVIKLESWGEIDEEKEKLEEKNLLIDMVNKTATEVEEPEHIRNFKVRVKYLEEKLKNADCWEVTGIKKRVEICKSLVEAWRKPLGWKNSDEFDKIKKEVVGFEEFIEEIANYLKVVHKPRKSGNRISPSQRFYLLLGKPGIGKSYISAMMAKYLGKRFININCASANLGELVGIPNPYAGANFGKIILGMAENKDRAPLILFDEIDKCKDEEVLNTISILFDDTKNKTDFDDKFLQSTVPMNEAFFVATANNEKNIPDFVFSRCNQVNISILNWQQRMKIARKEFESCLKHYEIEQYFPLITEELLKKCLVKEWGIRQTKINVIKIVDQIDSLDTEYGGDKEINMSKINIPIDLTSYPWSGIIKSDGLDPNCPARQKDNHNKECGCFFSEEVLDWNENMEKKHQQEEEVKSNAMIEINPYKN